MSEKSLTIQELERMAKVQDLLLTPDIIDKVQKELSLFKDGKRYFIFLFGKYDVGVCYQVIKVNTRKEIGHYLNIFWDYKFLVYYSTNSSIRVYENSLKPHFFIKNHFIRQITRLY